MGTRSAIGIKHGDVVKAVYCHYDGYPEYMGRVLTLYYQDSIKVNKLISMGDMSSIGAAIGSKHAFNDRSNYLDNGIAEQCTFYARDRGEENVDFRTFQSEHDFLDNFNAGEEFHYLFKDGAWYYSENGNEFEELTPNLIMTLLEKQPA
jgi:hypothetical protein